MELKSKAFLVRRMLSRVWPAEQTAQDSSVEGVRKSLKATVMSPVSPRPNWLGTIELSNQVRPPSLET